MKITVFTFTEDTDSGTDSHLFGTEADLHAHMRKVIVDSYGESVVECEGKLCDKDHTLTEDDEQVLVHLNGGEIEEAFLHWKDEGSTCGHLDSYNWDEKELEVALPTEHARYEAFVQEFLSTFAPYVHEDEAIPGAFAVDRIVALVNALHADGPLPPRYPSVITEAIRLATRDIGRPMEKLPCHTGICTMEQCGRCQRARVIYEAFALIENEP